ncbi:hypothetical protein RI129_006423 [Pyrocoelia pectoralis]|uniref:Short-chain dehydrogenase/reductase 3 n=1 Tax=Pyrocoelia pectoralis TaxID=417401 RepID=A0AAN7VGX1_9COLE
MLLFILNLLCVTLKATWRFFIAKGKKSVKGEIVLITGTAQGLGRQLAIGYASKGATVVCVDIQEESNKETVKIISDLGYEKAHAYKCDVSDYAKVLEMCQKVESEVGNVTILINNAGVSYVNFLGRLCETSKAEIEQIISVNILSHFWTLKAILPSMLKNNYGHIVAISSMSSFCGLPLLIPYSTSKYAVKGLMDSLQKELALYENCQVKTTTIHPFFVDTQMVKQANAHFPSFIPIYKQDYVAKSIMNAQRREIIETTVPSYYLPFRCLLGSIPAKCIGLFYRYFNIEVQPNPNSKNKISKQ